jgi:uncharacterized phiE125 gp8 family phage protein
MSIDIERVYLGKNNAIDITINADDIAADLSAVTRMTLTIGSTVLDSATSPGVFDWSAGSGALVLTLGGSTLTAGIYDAPLVLYDSAHTSGLMWGTIPITVIAATSPTVRTGPGRVLDPVIDPVLLAEVKQHLRIDDDIYDGDDHLAELINTATEYVEDITRRAIMTQTWDICFSSWPDSDYITLPYGNLQSVTHIKYKDTDGVEYTMTPTTDYLVEVNGELKGRIVLPYGVSWPSDVLYPSNPITIRFVCGWTTEALVPSRIKSAIKMICSELNENRGERIIGQLVTKNDFYDNLLASERLW